MLCAICFRFRMTVYGEWMTKISGTSVEYYRLRKIWQDHKLYAVKIEPNQSQVKKPEKQIIVEEYDKKADKINNSEKQFVGEHHHKKMDAIIKKPTFSLFYQILEKLKC